MIPRRPLTILCAFFLATMLGTAAAGADDFTDGIAEAADGFLETLGESGDKAEFDFTDTERFNWHYTPRRRAGLAIRDMTDRQRESLKLLMRSSLSSTGILKAEDIMELERILAHIEGSSLSYRDPENYLVSIFGTPGEYPFGWRLEGHHLSINVTVAAPGEVSITPTFLGSNPAKVPSGPREGHRTQYDEFVLAVRLAHSMTDAQMTKARIGERSLGNIVTGPGRGDALDAPVGIPASELSEPQRTILLELIATYVGVSRDEVGRPYMLMVQDHLDETRFAWAGPVSEHAAFYYRIHGPRVLIEFDNTQNDANHIHSLWRDPVNDFGQDDLHRHYKDAPAAHGHKP